MDTKPLDILNETKKKKIYEHMYVTMYDYLYVWKQF